MRIERKYTLAHKPFRDGLEEGARSEAYFGGKDKLIVVGGAAAQLFLQGGPYFLRPTTDVDFIVNRGTKKSERRGWAKQLASQLRERGYDVTGGLSRYGGIVSFDNLGPDLGVSLDSFGQNYFNRHNYRFDLELERSESINLNGQNVRYQSPMDIILNKFRRMDTLVRMRNLRLDFVQKGALHALRNGDLDAINVENLTRRLKDLDRVRNQNLEELEKKGYHGIIDQVNLYKIMKDLSDVAHVIDQSRRKGIRFSKKDYLKGLELVLR